MFSWYSVTNAWYSFSTRRAAPEPVKRFVSGCWCSSRWRIFLFTSSESACCRVWLGSGSRRSPSVFFRAGCGGDPDASDEPPAERLLIRPLSSAASVQNESAR